MLSYKSLIKKILKDLKPSNDLTHINLDGFLLDSKRAFEKSLQNKRFVDPIRKNKPLFIPLNKVLLSTQIVLPTKNFLHLHSLSFYDSNGDKLKKSDIKIVDFSSIKDGEKFTKKNLNDLLNTNGTHKRAFHTKYEEKPWIKISFTKKIYISGMIIKNINNARLANRATGLLVKTSSDLLKWNTAYNLGGVSNFVVELEKISQKYGIDKCEYGPELVEFIRLIIQGNNIDTAFLYKNMPEQYRKIITNPINKIILYERNLELISHGPRRSFRFWSMSEKQKFIRLTMTIIKDLKDLSKDVCLGFGTVLAIYRDKDLMPHDDDTDTLIAFDKSRAPTLRDAQNLVKEHLEKRGYEVSNEGYSHCWVRKSGLKVDVFVGIYDEDNTVGWIPGPRGMLKRSDVFPARKSNLLGVECEVPKRTERYLEVTYGPGWRHPDPNHVHNWDEYYYKDISGV